MKKKPKVLSHREFNRNKEYQPTENPRIVAIRMQADQLAKRIKKEGVQ